MKKINILIIIILLFASVNNAFAGTTYSFDTLLRGIPNAGNFAIGYETMEKCNEARQSKINEILALGAQGGEMSVSVCEATEARLTQEEVTKVSADTSSASFDIVYKPLAPLTDEMRLNGIKTTDVGAFFNIIVKIAIGLCGALAVIIFIISGITYMGDDSIFAKTEAKSKMTSAVFGLLIALASWALLNTINPDLLGGNGLTIKTAKIEIEPLYDRGINDPKNAEGESTRCTPVLSGPCSVANLTTIFGAENAVAMSKICNMESGGTNATSGTDICKPGNTAFSFGLFQVNLAANGQLAGEDCANLFDKKVIGKDVIEPRYSNGYNCKLLPGNESLYETCKNRLLNPNTNLAIAKSLFTADKKAWLGDKKYCASAFK